MIPTQEGNPDWAPGLYLGGETPDPLTDTNPLSHELASGYIRHGLHVIEVTSIFRDDKGNRRKASTTFPDGEAWRYLLLRQGVVLGVQEWVDWAQHFQRPVAESNRPHEARGSHWGQIELLTIDLLAWGERVSLVRWSREGVTEATPTGVEVYRRPELPAVREEGYTDWGQVWWPYDPQNEPLRWPYVCLQGGARLHEGQRTWLVEQGLASPERVSL